MFINVGNNFLKFSLFDMVQRRTEANIFEKNAKLTKELEEQVRTYYEVSNKKLPVSKEEKEEPLSD